MSRALKSKRSGRKLPACAWCWSTIEADYGGGGMLCRKTGVSWCDPTCKQAHRVALVEGSGLGRTGSLATVTDIFSRKAIRM